MAEQPAVPSPRSSAEEAFAELGRIPLAEASLQTVLGKVADLARELLPGLPAVSVTLLANDEAETAVATDGLARELDESQYARGYGPCLEAAAGGELVEITDAREEQRWPAYTAQLVTHGVFATLSVPLPVQQQVCAALNVYSSQAHAFDGPSRDLATRFASYAGVAVSNVRTFEDMKGLAEGLQIAMASRSVIDQAKGVLIERFKLTPDQAFRVLAAVSMATNTKLREVADRLVSTGELPMSPRSDRRAGQTSARHRTAAAS
jgi:GAF domain-containing protein